MDIMIAPEISNAFNYVFYTPISVGSQVTWGIIIAVVVGFYILSKMNLK